MTCGIRVDNRHMHNGKSQSPYSHTFRVYITAAGFIADNQNVTRYFTQFSFFFPQDEHFSALQRFRNKNFE